MGVGTPPPCPSHTLGLTLFLPTQLGRRPSASSVGNSRAVLPGNPGGRAVLHGRPAQPRTFCWATGGHGARSSPGREDGAKRAAVLCLAPEILPRRRLRGSVGEAGVGAGVSDFAHALGLPQRPRQSLGRGPGGSQVWSFRSQGWRPPWEMGSVPRPCRPRAADGQRF